jgi:hypothetical protein
MRLLGTIKFGEPEVLSDELIRVSITEDERGVLVENLDTGESIRIPRHVAKEVGRTIVRGQRP